MPLEHIVPTAIIALILEWNGDFSRCVWLTSLINDEFLEGKDHLLFISIYIRMALESAQWIAGA